MTPRAERLLAELRAHAPADERERGSLDRIREFVASSEDPFSRENPAGHVTGSAIVARPDGSAFLLIHHRKMERWLQPGGHSDPEDATVFDTALREVREETGADALVAGNAGRVLDVDVHPIPARGSEPAHFHFDLRYLVVFQGDAGPGEPQEISGIAWFSLEEALVAGVDESLARTLRKAAASLKNGS
ncbi:MAG: NUDIX hydrolase [Acidobacteriota bacterium]|nr:NUDIX hydrolase [Acidobacteriota bacterium]